MLTALICGLPREGQPATSLVAYFFLATTKRRPRLDLAIRSDRRMANALKVTAATERFSALAIFGVDILPAICLSFFSSAGVHGFTFRADFLRRAGAALALALVATLVATFLPVFLLAIFKTLL